MLTRRQMLLASGAAVLPVCTRVFGADEQHPTAIFKAGERPKDFRLGAPKTLNDYFPFAVPKTKEEWAARRQIVREQTLVSHGLWPMPEKTKLEPVIHGKIERDGYTVEKVFFASTPGHYVCGNLYRPNPADNKEHKFPAILCPHGHWNNGRLYENGDAAAKKEIESGAEQTMEGAKYPLQARCQMLARMGFVVFFYDMIGYADSKAIPHIAKSGVPHPEGFADAEGELRLQSLMGLQTWNSIRALDFIESLPDVDAKRIGITGASGGGTQTFVLAAIDDRVQAAFPAVMVSTAMQGGCICENCSLFRVGTGNIELSAVFAPKPMAMSGAKDWTEEIETKGYPELKQLWKLLGKEENVLAKAFPQFPHNYNQVAREMMYGWFNKHLLGVDKPVAELPFKPVPPAELRVFDDKYPRPADELKAKELRAKLSEASDARMAKLLPTDQASAVKYQGFLRVALRAMITDELPSEIAIRSGPVESKHDGFIMHRAVLGRKNEADAVPHAGVVGPKFDGRTVIWLHPKGKASLFEGEALAPAVKTLVDAGFAVVAPDVLGVGELAPAKPFAVSEIYTGFTYGYNRPLFAERVHDVLTTVAFTQFLKSKTTHLIGWGEFGPVAIVARAAAGAAIDKLIADGNNFKFAGLKKPTEPMMLPGALKYGDLAAFVALAAPGKTNLFNVDFPENYPATRTYAASDHPEALEMKKEALTAREVVAWLKTD